MKNTRLMEVLFSAVENNDEELTAQVANDIEAAKEHGVVDTDEVTYENAGDGRVAITDKETGEVTIAEKADDDAETYDLYPAEVTEQVEGFIHPEADGVTPGAQVGTRDEDVVEDHLGAPISECYEEGSVEEVAEEGPYCEDEECEEEEEREFSVATDNTVVLRIFSDQEFCERVFSEVIESEETAKVGDLKIEKDAEDENAVIVTNETTGDQAKVVLEDDEMEVTELESKSFSEEEQFDALHVVGVDTFNHQIVDAPEYSEESAQELVERLTEQGVDAVQVFDNPEDAREYAIELLDNLGVESEEDVEEPEQVEFSDHTIFVTRYFSSNTVLMDRLFSEAANDVDASQEDIEDAIENGEEIETDTEVITPIDAVTAIIEDKENDEFTKVTLDGEDMEFEAITEEEAEELTDHIAVEDDDDEDDDDIDEEDDEDIDEDDEDEEDDDDEDEEKTFSDCGEIYCDEEETKFFSEYEEMTEYMIRLFSDESDSENIEDAIENGEQIETDTEIITPIDATTAVIEDKESGEFTKAVMDDEDLDINPISEEEAEELTDHLAVEDDDEEEEENDEEEEKEFSTLDKFFSDALASNAQPAPAGQMMFNVDENGNPISPVGEEAPQGEEPQADAPQAPAVPTVEAVEDKALAAVQSIQAAAAEAEAAIMNAKAAPVENAEEDLREAQFSEFDEEEFTYQDDTLLSWLGNTKR